MRALDRFYRRLRAFGALLVVVGFVEVVTEIVERVVRERLGYYL